MKRETGRRVEGRESGVNERERRGKEGVREEGTRERKRV